MSIVSKERPLKREESGVLVVGEVVGGKRGLRVEVNRS